MAVIALSLVLFLLAAAGLSLGLMLGRGSIRGSCRAIGEHAGEKSCICAEPCPRRRRELARAARSFPEPLP
jgi:hypothetical protein